MSPIFNGDKANDASFPRVSGDEPASCTVSQAASGFPRVSGDEPASSAHDSPANQFSPRERG